MEKVGAREENDRGERGWGTGENGGGKREAKWVPEKVGGTGKG